MARASRQAEVHLSLRSNWLRAAVLGAKDGILSTSSLVLGVAASGASSTTVVVAGIAGMTAGALPMAAGEYVSVSSRRDAERADLRLEARELSNDPEGELRALTLIYERRVLPPILAREVALALSDRDALAAHARDELGLTEQRFARPLQAAWASALSFAAGAILPLIAVAVTAAGLRVVVCVLVTLLSLALLGDLGARLGGARRWRATLRALVGSRGHGDHIGDRRAGRNDHMTWSRRLLSAANARSRPAGCPAGIATDSMLGADYGWGSHPVGC